MAEGWKYRKTPALAVLLLALSPPALAAERVALVIGNAGYAHAPGLANPLNDAADVGSALTRLGFAVTRLENAGQGALRQGLLAFTRAASAAEVAVVFYAGHGIEVDQRNFLVPVDARLSSDQDVEFETVPLELVMRSVARASGLRLVILDACRENPFAVTMQRSGATRSVGRGLARVEPGGDTLVAYAAKEGTLASDGEGRNSPYSTALLAHLEEPGLEVGLLFRKVRDAVLAATGGRQEPFVYGSLSSRGVYLTAQAEPDATLAPASPPTDGAPASPRLTAEQLAAERVFWESVKDSANAADIQAYLDRYPGGTYEVLARNRLQALQGAEQPSAAPEETVESVEGALELSRADRRLIQLGLLAAGFELGKADGLIGERTRAALGQWQASRREAVTGYLDVASAKLLLAAGEQELAHRAAAEAERLRREQEARQQAQRKAEARDRREAEERARREAAAEAQRLRREQEAREREARAKARREAEARKKWERLGLVMVRVNGGRFTMGCQRGRDRKCEDDEKPAHRVRVRSFEIGKYEVTQALWEAVMGDNPSIFTGCAQCPVENVSWDDVQVFLRKLNGLTGARYRLPTEAEWEYAARGGRQSRDYQYAGGNDAGSVGWYGVNSGERTHPVGGKRANELGLHDMSGNVFEWVQDCWNDDYRGTPDDGRAWERGDCGRRVMRGGSWDIRPGFLRAASRFSWWTRRRDPLIPMILRGGFVGFRIARTLTP